MHDLLRMVEKIVILSDEFMNKIKYGDEVCAADFLTRIKDLL